MDLEEKKNTVPTETKEAADSFFSREALVWGWAGAMLMLFFLVFVNALFNTDTTQLIAVFGCYQGFHNLALFKLVFRCLSLTEIEMQGFDEGYQTRVNKNHFL